MTQLASDDFNRANATLDASGNWTAFASLLGHGASNGLNVVSNECKDTGADIAIERYTGIAWPNDQYAQLTLKTLATTSDEGIGPAVRMTQNVSLYFAQCNSGEIRLYKYINGSSFSQLGIFTGTISVGDVIRLEVQGTSLTVKRNGATVIGPVTDASLASGDAGIWSSLPSPVPTGDDWSGGDFAPDSIGLPWVTM